MAQYNIQGVLLKQISTTIEAESESEAAELASEQLEDEYAVTEEETIEIDHISEQ